MRIAILGWGSLIWDKRPELTQFQDQLEGDWQLDGPTLKLEFSRVSETRDDALTLVIDKDHGAETTVAWRLSRRHEVDEAVCDLRCREGTKLKRIGQIPRDEKSYPPPPGVEAIADWGRSKNLDAVVWTALQSNFREKAGKELSVSAAVAHIHDLITAGKGQKAVEYIQKAPGWVNTPLRTALKNEPWFATSGSAEH